MKKTTIIYLLILAWVLAIIWSFWSSGAIEGPRNLDTGFKRLDVFFKTQFVALAIAIVTAVIGFVFGGRVHRLRLIGLIPLGLTVLAIAGVIVFAVLVKDAPISNPQMPTKPTSPAVDQ